MTSPASNATTSSSSSSSSSTNSTLAPSIPSGLSSGCTTYLTVLNADPILAQCVTPLLTATTQAANANSSAALTTSLTKLCAASPCSDTTIRTKLSEFYGACSVELNGNEDETVASVREIYDLLYVVQPLREVVCTKDNSTQAFCVQSLATALGSPNTTANANFTSTNVIVTKSPESLAAAHLSIDSPANPFGKRSFLHARAADASSTVSYPNSTTYRTTNLPYLFLQPTSPLAALCSSCAKAVFTAYASWEYRTPYALGLSASPILGGQAQLWKGAEATCGPTWISGVQTTAIGSEGAAAVGGSSGATAGTSGAERELMVKGVVVAMAVIGAGWAFAA